MTRMCLYVICLLALRKFEVFPRGFIDIPKLGFQILEQQKLVVYLNGYFKSRIAME